MEKNIKIIDAENAIMGRLASYVARQALRGEEIIILNSEKAIITGNRKNIQKEFLEGRGRVGSGQEGPKISRSAEKILKRTIRGMLPHRSKRGIDAMKRIRCYSKTPREFENSKKILAGKEKPVKYIEIKKLIK